MAGLLEGLLSIGFAVGLLTGLFEGLSVLGAGLRPAELFPDGLSFFSTLVL